MSKNELLKLLEDPEVVAKILAMKRTNPAMSPQGEKIAMKIITWWNGVANKATIPDLGVKIDVLEAVKRHGNGKVKEVLAKAIESPLNGQGSYMVQYLSDIGWCIKLKNFDKIDSRKYSSTFTTKTSKAEVLKDTSQSDLEGLEQ